jgi:hypothetical protein
VLGLLAIWIFTLLLTSLTRPASRKILIPVAAIALIAILTFLILDPRHHSNNNGSYETYALATLGRNLSTRLHNEIPANVQDLLNLTVARSIFGMPLGTPWLNAFFGIILFLAGLSLLRINLLWGLWVAATFAMLVIFVSHDRYLLQILPLMVLGWWRLIKAINLQLPQTLGNLIFLCLLFIGIAPNLLQDANVIRLQHLHPFLAYYKEGRFPPYVTLANDLPIYTTPQDIILTPERYSRILTFLADRTAMERGEFNPDTPPHNLFVALDPEDPNYAAWLAENRVILDPTPLKSFPRTSGKSPIQLFHAQVK